MQGHVKWFSADRGWGFITGSDGNDYFVHHRLILGDGFKILLGDDEVEFQPARDENNRMMARDVKKI